jgi:protein-tyrosine-phosphatase
MAAPALRVLFVCTSNAIRSPMAADLMRRRHGPLAEIESVGVRPALEIHPMAALVMDELGLDLTRHRPKGFDELDEDARYDAIVTLSPEAHHLALEAAARLGAIAEYWPTLDPSLCEGPREQRLEEYRMVRDGLDRRIAERFPRTGSGD